MSAVKRTVRPRAALGNESGLVVSKTGFVNLEGIMSRYERSLSGAMVVGCVSMIAIASAAWAETVTLRLKSGGLSVEGNLVSFDGNAYVIRSDALGTMSLDADKFACVGAACSKAKEWNPYASAAKSGTSQPAPIEKPVRPIKKGPNKSSKSNPYETSPLWQALTGNTPSPPRQ
ncbi:MAG: hypothetical protein ACR2PO_17660 [Methyloligellaceae bacterium]